MAGVRPILIFTYWLNYKISGNLPTGYHVLNLVIHTINTVVIFLLLFRLLELAGWTGVRRTVVSGIGATVFLVHPLQTESVSYIAGRSESLAATFVILAYLVFLYRRAPGISWRESAIVLLLLAAGLGTKENAIAMVGVLILTDIFWPVPFSTDGLRRNWRLYVLMAPGAIAGAFMIARVLARSSSAGFALPVTWYQYGFTEARAFFTYLQLAVLPIGQSIDHDYAVSHSIWEHGTIFHLLLLALLAVLCIGWRRRYPLACFGLLITWILLAPTSSIVPINDPLVERRMYLPLFGLILIGCELAARVRVSARTGWSIVSVMVVTYGVLCYQRNQLWSQPSQLWERAALQSTTNVRPYTNLVDELVQEHRCGEALPYLQRADATFPNDYAVQMSWGRALECLGKRGEALERLQRAAAIHPCSYVYQLIGLLYGEMGSYADAGKALQKAIEWDPASVGAHNAFALWNETVANLAAAEKEYRTSLDLDKYDRTARMGVARVRQALANR